MMRDAEKTIGNLIDKQRVSYIASISEDGFPNMKAIGKEEALADWKKKLHRKKEG